jgi:hypothetical protein
VGTFQLAVVKLITGGGDIPILVREAATGGAVPIGPMVVKTAMVMPMTMITMSEIAEDIFAIAEVFPLVFLNIFLSPFSFNFSRHIPKLDICTVYRLFFPKFKTSGSLFLIQHLVAGRNSFVLEVMSHAAAVKSPVWFCSLSDPSDGEWGFSSAIIF